MKNSKSGELTFGTRVITQRGYVPIEYLGINDKLMTRTGKFQSIANLQRKSYANKLYHVRLKYHPTSIVCTAKNMFYVRERTKKWNGSIRRYEISFKNPVWKTADCINANDYCGMLINKKSSIPSFSYTRIINKSTSSKEILELNKPDQWFMMGYFLGDGWIEEGKKRDGRLKYTIRFAINNASEKSVCARIQTVLPITDKKCNTGRCKKFGCGNQQWHCILSDFGKYAYGKRIPEWVQDAPIDLLEEFISGYVNADGCVRSDGSWSMTTVSENIAFGIQRIFLKLGKFSSVTKFVRPKNYVIEGRTVNQRDTYVIRVFHSANRYSSFIDVKKGYAWFAPFRITQTRSDVKTYEFELSADGAYVVDNAIMRYSPGV